MLTIRRYALLALLVLAPGCSNLSKPSNNCSFATVTGTVVSRPPVPGNAGWQLEPDLCKGKYVRLTTNQWETMNPEDNEIDLAPYANKRIKVNYKQFNSFLWEASIVCVMQ